MMKGMRHITSPALTMSKKVKTVQIGFKTLHIFLALRILSVNLFQKCNGPVCKKLLLL